MRTHGHLKEVLPPAEDLLLDYAERLQRHLPGRRAIYLHLSKLRRLNRRRHHVAMAAASFDQLARRAQGQVFRLGNDDVIVVVKGVGVAEIDEVVLRLRYMFDDDPLVHRPDDASEGAKFCVWFDLEIDYAAFLAVVRAVHKRAVAQRVQEAAKAEQSVLSNRAPTPTLEPLDPHRLSRIAQVIAPADLVPMLRRQPICQVPEVGPIKVVGNELFVSIDALGRQVAPTVDLRADPWLFQYLIALLDRRVMSVLPGLEASIALPTNLNLTLDALASPEFLAFDAKLREVTPKPMVAEINWLDALRDTPNYLFVRDMLRLRNWRVALDGLSATNYAMIDCAALDPDYVKLAWNADLADHTPSKARAAFLDALERTAPQKLVLMHCGEAAAVRFGRSMHIALYQGRQIDAVLKGRAAAA